MDISHCVEMLRQFLQTLNIPHSAVLVQNPVHKYLMLAEYMDHSFS